MTRLNQVLTSSMTIGKHGWLLDEVAHAGRENLDPEHVSHYDLKEDAGAAEEVLLCQSLGLKADSVVIELSTGTGQFATAVAPFCSRVVAVDVSPVMLNVLQAKVDKAKLNNVEIVHAGFLTYAHQGNPADLVYSRYALHHLPDFWKAVALSRIHGILRPGGVFRLWDAVYNFEPTAAEGRIEAWCSSYDTTGDKGWIRADLEEHVRDEHTTFTWLLEPMFECCGFVIEDADYAEDGIFAKYVLRVVDVSRTKLDS